MKKQKDSANKQKNKINKGEPNGSFKTEKYSNWINPKYGLNNEREGTKKRIG